MNIDKLFRVLADRKERKPEPKFILQAVIQERLKNSFWKIGTSAGRLVPLLKDWYHFWKIGTTSGRLVPLLKEFYHFWKIGTPFGRLVPLLEDRHHFWKSSTTSGRLVPLLEDWYHFSKIVTTSGRLYHFSRLNLDKSAKRKYCSEQLSSFCKEL